MAIYRTLWMSLMRSAALTNFTIDLVEWFFVLTATAYNLVRIPKILAATG